MRGDGLGDVGVGMKMPGVAALDLRAERHHRNILARVVAALVGRVVAVVGGQDHEVARLQDGDQLRQAAIEFFQAIGIAGDVAAVAEKLVEVDEVGEDEIAVLRLRASLPACG